MAPLFFTLLCWLGLAGAPAWPLAQTPLQQPVIARARYVLVPQGVWQVEVDVLGNTFVITRAGELLRYDTALVRVANFRELRYGLPGYIDVSDPFNVVLCYPEAARATALDNMLVPKAGGLQLVDNAIARHAVACRAQDGSLWFFNERDYRLQKIDFSGRPILTGGAVEGALLGGPVPVRLQSNGQQVWATLKDGGVLVFDVFGGFVRRLPLPGQLALRVQNGGAFYRVGQQIEAYLPGQPFADTVFTLPAGVPEGESWAVRFAGSNSPNGGNSRGGRRFLGGWQQAAYATGTNADTLWQVVRR